MVGRALKDLAHCERASLPCSLPGQRCRDARAKRANCANSITSCREPVRLGEIIRRRTGSTWRAVTNGLDEATTCGPENDHRRHEQYGRDEEVENLDRDASPPPPSNHPPQNSHQPPLHPPPNPPDTS